MLMIVIANLNPLPLLRISKTQHGLSSFFGDSVCVNNKISKEGVCSGVVHYEQTREGLVDFEVHGYRAEGQVRTKILDQWV